MNVEPHENEEQAEGQDGRRNEGDASETVIVIGSGFGGAVTACRLAEAGFKVVILERGRRYNEGDYPNLPDDSSFLPDTRRWAWSIDQGLWDVIDLEEIVSVQGAGYGGGSLVYANVHLRPPRGVFDAAWPARDQNRAGLDEYFDLAAYMLEVSPVDAHPLFQREIVKSAQMSAAAASLNRSVFYPPLAIRYEPDGKNIHGVDQRACTGCGACCSGCPQRAKNTLDLNYLALAEGHGAQVITQCEVTGLVEEKPGHWIIRCFDHLEASKRTFKARHVFLCTGSVHSTRLMADAQLRRTEDATRRDLKKWVGVGYFPGGDALGIVYETVHRQQPSVGPVISTALVESSSAADLSSFFMLQDGGYPPAADRLVGTLRASAWLDRNKLSKSGDAAVPANRPFRQPRLLGEPAVPIASNRRVSPVDDLIRAQRSGAFAKIVPEPLRGIRKYIAHLLSLPLTLSAVVAETILRGAISKLARWLPGCIRRLIVWIEVKLAASRIGTDEELGDRAPVALSEGGRLTPEALAARVAGYDDAGREHRAVILAMGRDSALGVLHYDRKTKRLKADLDFARLTPGYARQETLMTEIAKKLGGELRTNPAWDFLRKPITVHNQGGCRMSDDPWSGVTDPFGKVHGRSGLYILDGSILCGSVGVNPSATIAALAERGVLKFIRCHRPNWPEGDTSRGADEYRKHQTESREWAAKADAAGWNLTPPLRPPPPPAKGGAVPIGLAFTEQMSGYYHGTARRPRSDAEYLALENRGRPDDPVEVTLELRTADLAAFYEDPDHVMEIGGSIRIQLPGYPPSKPFQISGGKLNLLVPPEKDYAIPAEDTRRRRAQQVAIDGRYRSVHPDDRPVRERLVRYALPFQDSARRSWVLHGYKRIAPTSTIESWTQTSILHFTLSAEDPTLNGAFVTIGAGAAHVDLTAFLFTELPSIEATGTEDKARQAWAIAGFSAFFFGTLLQIYLPALRAAARRSSGRRRLALDKP